MSQTLEEALRVTAMSRWQGKRCYATNMSQAQRAIVGVMSSYAEHNGHPAYSTRVASSFLPGRASARKAVLELTVEDALPFYVQDTTAKWYASGLSPATIQKRLNCLSAMGVNVDGAKVQKTRALKWWLNPEDERRVLEYLRAPGYPGEYAEVANFIEWTTNTGLRIEESLRVRRQHLQGLGGGPMSLTVDGTKSEAAGNVTLALSSKAAAVARDCFAVASELPTALMFVVPYDKLNSIWQQCRSLIGASDNPTATLKALRRSAARKLHIQNGMPLDMVRQYLRHENIQTTMEYLRLTGGYGTDEMRRYLK